MKKLNRIIVASLTAIVGLTAYAWEATGMRLSTAQPPEQNLLKVEGFSTSATAPDAQKRVSVYAPVTNQIGRAHV